MTITVSYEIGKERKSVTNSRNAHLKPIGDWKQNFRRHLSPEVAWNPLGTSFRGGAARRRHRPTKF